MRFLFAIEQNAHNIRFPGAPAVPAVAGADAGLYRSGIMVCTALEDSKRWVRHPKKDAPAING
jgi:hypothetical protein